MGLIISKDFDTGVTATYWRIYQTNISWGDGNAHIDVAGYVDQAAREAGKRPLATKSFDFSGDTFAPFAALLTEADTLPNLVKWTYDLLKTDLYFSGAQDI